MAPTTQTFSWMSTRSRQMRINYSPLHAVMLVLGTLVVIPLALLATSQWAWPCRWSPLQRRCPGFSAPHKQPGESPFSLISPTSSLKYSSCYGGGYQCARLEVPMDWNSTTDPDTVALAVIRLPARVPVTDPRYGGMIVVNPGGPGGSGVYKMLVEGKRLQGIVDTKADPQKDVDFKTNSKNADKYYDIICYDGRGVNNTTPRFSCIDDAVARQKWTLDNKFSDLVGSSNVATNKALARALALAGTCSGENGPKLGAFINTTPSVADIVAITEAHGKWRQEEALALIAQKRSLSSLEKNQIKQATAWDKDNEKLQYWGYSYATVTGTTFAAMYPEKVKRLIVDGICDPNAMYNGFWTTSIQDTDKIVTRFFEDCYKAGPSECPLYSDKGPANIQATFETTLQSLNTTPLAVSGGLGHGPEVITFSDVLRLIKDAVYTPMAAFPVLADLVADVSSGNGSKFATYKAKAPAKICASRSLDEHAVEDCPPFSETIYDVLTAISCTDGQDLSRFSNKSQVFDEYYSLLRTQSKWMADIWMSWTLSCWDWKTRPKWRYEGPMAANPAHPILWIGNTLDPATPLRNAHKLSKDFVGSVVLTQDSAGHCSYSSNSECINDHVRTYFQTGDLPEIGTVCAPDKQPWGNSA
ncbi:uncharacterized protein RAG0_09219 [Rhynchosporium agropyri]|uniref:Peptidase S33 tripeptidyl aminopeptidase-like C-terminal domain-containing protein n=1 Tax=Rhynchosporium agropyri TaxID=914238 RepID=A0A1E1KUC2_9HELO|nr:uncharacterized protein RAG0_09219 [Rhynchosporium agropyri]